MRLAHGEAWGSVMQLSCSGVNNPDETKVAKPGEPENQDPTQDFQLVVIAASKSFICLANSLVEFLAQFPTSPLSSFLSPTSRLQTPRAPDRPDHRTSWPLPRHFHFHSPQLHEIRYIRPTDCESSKTLHLQLASL